MSKSEFVYTIYIKTTPQKLWEALTSPEFQRQYWFGAHCESGWQAGSAWKLCFADGETADAGEIVESVVAKRLVIKWRNEWKQELKAEGYSRCTFEIEPVVGGVRLNVTHRMEQESSKLIEAVSGGWPQVLSNLKSLIETGEVVMKEHVDCRGK